MSAATPRHALPGVALVLHGLNQRPECMGDVTKLLRDRGVECASVALRGHGGGEPGESLRAMRRIRLADWLDETRSALALARLRARDLGTPLLVVGYSLGALLALDVLSDPDEPWSCDGLLLFAPAVTPRRRAALVHLLSPFPGLVLPSLAPAEYRANPGVPVAAYAALLESVGRVARRSLRRVDVPTCVFIDRGDELVSETRLRTLRAAQALDRWQIVAIERRLRRGEPDFHHLVTARERLGEELWALLERHVDLLLGELRGKAASVTETSTDPSQASLRSG